MQKYVTEQTFYYFDQSFKNSVPADKKYQFYSICPVSNYNNILNVIQHVLESY